MLKAAVIGCGRMGAEPSDRLEGSIPAGWLPISHAECLRHVPNVELVALADVDADRLASNRNRYGVSGFADYRELLAEVRPDIVTVATRTPEKPAIIEAVCANAVRALYVEKPLANTLGDARALLARLSQVGIRIGYGVNRRYHAAYRFARELIQQGEIGQVLDITVEFGRSALLWAHPHSVDLILFFAQETKVSSIQAQLDVESDANLRDHTLDVDPIVEHAYFVFESGVRATITRAGGCTVRIGGSMGTLTVHGDGAYIQVNKERSAQRGYFLDQSVLNVFPVASATVTALSELCRDLDSNSFSAIAPSEIEGGMAMLLGAAWSHCQGGRSIAISEIPRDFMVTGRFRGMYA